LRSHPLSFVALASVLLLALASCGGTGGGAPAEEAGPFSQAEEAARGTTVNFFMYGGDDATNAYVDDWVAPQLEEEHGVTLRRTPVSDAAEVVNKLLNEKGAGDDEGAVDLV